MICHQFLLCVKFGFLSIKHGLIIDRNWLKTCVNVNAHMRHRCKHEILSRMKRDYFLFIGYIPQLKVPEASSVKFLIHMLAFG